VASLSQGRTAAAQCGLFTHKSVPVIFEPPCTYIAHLLLFHTMTNKSTITSRIINYYKLPEDDMIVLKHVGVW